MPGTFRRVVAALYHGHHTYTLFSIAVAVARAQCAKHRPLRSVYIYRVLLVGMAGKRRGFCNTCARASLILIATCIAPPD